MLSQYTFSCGNRLSFEKLQRCLEVERLTGDRAMSLNELTESKQNDLRILLILTVGLYNLLINSAGRRKCILSRALVRQFGTRDCR